MKRFIWLFIGLALGVSLGFWIGWGLFPVEYHDTEPAALRADYKDEYIRLVALTYQVEGSLANARWRLDALDKTSTTAPLIELTERWIAQEKPAWRILPLAQLARALGVSTPAMNTYLD